MAQNNYKIQPDTPKKSTPSKSFILDQRTKITIGLLLQGITIFLACSFLAHLIHGAKDQHLIESIGKLGLKRSNMATGNWLGFIGAFLSYYCVHIWWGITAFIFLPCLFLIGGKMVTPRICPNLSLLKVTMASIFLLLWSNILLGYLHALYPTDTLLVHYLGGIGYTLGTLFKNLLGYGTFIFLVVTLIIFAVIFFNITSLPNINLFSSKKAKYNATSLFDNEGNKIVNETFNKESEAPSSKNE